MKKTSALVLLVCFILGTSLHASPPAGYGLFWSDEFDGTAIDTNTWNFDTGRGTPVGWGNQEWEYYAQKNGTIESGAAVLVAQKETVSGPWSSGAVPNYTSCRMTTKGKKSFKYGYIEVKLKAPQGDGLWPEFWTLGNSYSGGLVGWPECGEMDLYNQRTGNWLTNGTVGDNFFMGTCFFKGASGTSYNSKGHVYTDALSHDYHLYAVLWDSTLVEYYFDDQVYWSRTQTPSINQPSNFAAFHNPHFFLMNIAIMGNYVSGATSLKDSILPQKMYIDYVRVYQRSTVAPAAPTLASPSNGATDQPLSLSLAWNTVAGAVTYRTQVATDTGFASIVVNDSTLTTGSKAIGPLSNGTTYYWRVRAKNFIGNGAWSSVWSFTAVPVLPGVPSCLFPALGAENIALTTPLIWSAATNATSYRAQIATDVGFSSIVRDTGVSDTSLACKEFANNTHYYWRVNSTNISVSSQWSAPSEFTTIISLPSAVNLLSPVNGNIVRTDSVYLLWSTGTPQVDRYEVEYASTPPVSAAIIDSAVAGNVKLLSNLQDNSNVWWHVKAHNAAGWGAWSAEYVFAVKLVSAHVKPVELPKTFGFTISDRTGYIRYALPKAEHVFLRLYSSKGQLQSEPVNMQQDPGYYTVNIQRGAFAAGSYLLEFRAGEYHREKMIFLMK
jgi:beta-glucanase (GH16 family)